MNLKAEFRDDMHHAVNFRVSRCSGRQVRRCVSSGQLFCCMMMFAGMEHAQRKIRICNVQSSDSPIGHPLVDFSVGWPHSGGIVLAVDDDHHDPLHESILTRPADAKLCEEVAHGGISDIR